MAAVGLGPGPGCPRSSITKRYPRGLGPRRILNWLQDRGIFAVLVPWAVLLTSGWNPVPVPTMVIVTTSLDTQEFPVRPLPPRNPDPKPSSSMDSCGSDLRALPWTTKSLHVDNGPWCHRAGSGKRGQRTDILFSMRQLRQTVGRTTLRCLAGEPLPSGELRLTVLV